MALPQVGFPALPGSGYLATEGEQGWRAVRDAFTSYDEAKYGEAQHRYHHTHDTAVLEEVLSGRPVSRL